MDPDRLNIRPSQMFESCLFVDDMDGLRLEMSGLLKELHCPFKDVVSGILTGSQQSTKDYLKCVCM